MLMAHWLGRKYQMSIPRVIRTYGRAGNTLGTGKYTLRRADEFKVKRHKLRKIGNPYTSTETTIQRESLDRLEGEWSPENRTGVAEQNEVVYQRDQGICGICGDFVPWKEAHIDHKTPRFRFKPGESGDTLEHLWILHREPCHHLKTKRDRQSGRRVR